MSLYISPLLMSLDILSSFNSNIHFYLFIYLLIFLIYIYIRYEIFHKSKDKFYKYNLKNKINTIIESKMNFILKIIPRYRKFESRYKLIDNKKFLLQRKDFFKGERLQKN